VLCELLTHTTDDIVGNRVWADEHSEFDVFMANGGNPEDELAANWSIYFLKLVNETVTIDDADL